MQSQRGHFERTLSFGKFYLLHKRSLARINSQLVLESNFVQATNITFYNMYRGIKCFENKKPS